MVLKIQPSIFEFVGNEKKERKNQIVKVEDRKFQFCLRYFVRIICKRKDHTKVHTKEVEKKQP